MGAEEEDSLLIYKKDNSFKGLCACKKPLGFGGIGEVIKPREERRQKTKKTR